MRTVIYGASDDLIEVAGDLSEEFTANYDKPTAVRLSNGVTLTFEYTDDGVWRIEQAAGPIAAVEIFGERGEDTPGPRDDEDGCPNYSMKAVVDEPLSWIRCGDQKVSA